MNDGQAVCPYCHTPMKKWRTPPFSTWSAEYLYVCFNDECPYFVRGWHHMQATYAQEMSYRYYLDPTRGVGGPLPVASKQALRGDIIE